MSVMDLKQVKEYYSDTEAEAMDLLDRVKSEQDVIAHQITRKTKRIKGTKDQPGYDFEYWVVKITTLTYDIKDLLDSLTM
jgi:hypothetical protein